MCGSCQKKSVVDAYILLPLSYSVCSIDNNFVLSDALIVSYAVSLRQARAIGQSRATAFAPHPRKQLLQESQCSQPQLWSAFPQADLRRAINMPQDLPPVGGYEAVQYKVLLEVTKLFA